MTLRPGDVCVDELGSMCLVVGTPFLLSQWYAVQYSEGGIIVPLKADRDYLEKIGEL